MHKLTFSKTAIASLALKDQKQFERFGQGPIVKLPYECIHYAFEAQAIKQATTTAAIHLGVSITYGELNQQAEYLAALLAMEGVQQGDHVGLFVKRSIPMLVGILACLKLGAVYVPQDIGVSSESRLRYIIEKASIKVSLTLAKFKHKVPETTNSICLAIDEVLERSNTERHVIPNFKRSLPKLTRNDKCFILFTSGTTGKPNGVQVTHENLCNILLLSPGNLHIQTGWKVSQLLNIAFDMSAWEVLGCLTSGGTLIIRGKDIEEAASQADVIIATPSILSLIDPQKCTNVKKVAVAGEPCPVSLANKWSAICDFYNCCGPTETTIVNTMQLCTPESSEITIGTPTPNNTVYILNEHKQPCKIGEVGMMWAGGFCVTAGYINNDLLNAERYAPDPFLNNGAKMFRTGDLGRWTKDGQLEHHGRIDDQVKVRGFRVELDGISAVIESIPNCKRAVTLKLDNANLVSFVMPKNVDIQKAKEKVATELPYYYSPSFIIPVDKLPMTDRGKIDKRFLLQLALQHQSKQALLFSNITHSQNDLNDGQKKRA